MRTFIIKPGDLIPIGRAGENQATQIRFDVTGWADTFGAGTYTLVVKRPHEDTAYPVEVTVDGDYVVWTVSNVDTGIAGNASVQLRYVVDGALAKSVIYAGIVGESLDNIVDPPDPFEDLIQRMVDLTERTEAAATSAAGSAASASESAGTATAAKTAAQTAAQTAQTAQGTATQAAQTATQAKDAAQAAQQAAEAAQTTAAQSATAASGSATAAAGSATQAAASATAASASATAAAQSAAAAQAAAMDVIDKAPIITDTASGSVASFPDGADAPIKSITINIEPVQSGTGDPSPTNVRPIAGWTGADVGAAGRNLFDKTNVSKYNGYIDTSTNKIISASNNRIVYIPCKPNVTYTLQKVAVNSGSSDRFYMGWTETTPASGVQVYDFNGRSTGFVAGELYYYTITTGATAKYLACWLSRDTGYDASLQTFQIEVGSTAHDYQAYAGTSYPITWQTEAGTVYGGTLTVEQDGTGTLVATWYGVDLGALTWKKAGNVTGGFYAVLNGYPSYKMSANTQMLCSAYKLDGVGSSERGYYGGNGTVRYYYIDNPQATAREIYVHDETKASMTKEEYQAAMSGEQIVYELATPTTYTLTDAEMTTLLGQNNWWADTGDIAVEYRADTKLYIDKKLAALLAALS